MRIHQLLPRHRYNFIIASSAVHIFGEIALMVLAVIVVVPDTPFRLLSILIVMACLPFTHFWSIAFFAEDHYDFFGKRR